LIKLALSFHSAFLRDLIYSKKGRIMQSNDVIETILNEWKSKVIQEIPMARGQSTLALEDSIPDYLQNLFEQINNHEGKNFIESKEALIGAVHGQHRANNRYTIDQMIHEYFLLRDTIISHLKIHNLMTIEVCEYINCSIQKAVQESASQFSSSLLNSQENFVLSLAHDLRSPLMVIKLHAEMLQKKYKLEDKSIQKIFDSVTKVDDMVQDLLDQLKTKSVLNPTTDLDDFDFYSLIQELIVDYQDSYGDIFEFNGDQAFVKWNRSSIERVLDNLISNAVKYGDLSKKITLELQQDDKNIFFSIHNHGPPIPKEDQIDLFKKFNRSGNGNSSRGWGIGLSYVKDTIESHKGIVLVSSDDSGTTFKFELPKDVKTVQRESLDAVKH